MCMLQADQICYSVLCVFSYVAAGQDQKKNPVVITPQIQDIHAQQRQQLAKQQQQQQQNNNVEQPTNNVRSTKVKQQDSVTIRHTIPMQTPTITTTTVQPQAKWSAIETTKVSNTTTTTTATTKIPIITTTAQPQQQQQQQRTSPKHKAATLTTTTPTPTTTTTTTTPATQQLPQLPPRTPSLTSSDSPITSPIPKSRGPPPAIPPRTGAISRTGSEQASTGGPFAGARNFMRTISVNSSLPQFTPQPPPAFIIPKRRTSLSRAASVAAAPTAATSIPAAVGIGSHRPSYGSVHMGSSQSAATSGSTTPQQSKH